MAAETSKGKAQAGPTVSSGVDTPMSEEPGRPQASSLKGEKRRKIVLSSLNDGKQVPRDLRGIFLVGEDLRDGDFSGCDLSDADLTDSNLSGAKFVKSNLKGAVLSRACLEGSEFLGADLGEADLSECVGQRASFGHADLSEARLFQADLREATFGGAKLQNADLRIAQLRKANIQNADLTFADFTRADLSGSDLSESDVFQATFVYADLTGSRLKRIKRFERANWIGADIRDMDLHGAYQVRRFIMDENYLHEFRSRSQLASILYRAWWLTSDCGRSFSRWAAWTVGVVVVFALLYGLVDLDYGRHGTTIVTRLYYSVVTITTLGYGDIVPISLAGKVLVIAEVALGYLTLGGLISILANKMARRAE
jgi:uncharacterized protein YjbI with pentapeptide repeats